MSTFSSQCLRQLHNDRFEHLQTIHITFIVCVNLIKKFDTIS